MTKGPNRGFTGSTEKLATALLRMVDASPHAQREVERALAGYVRRLPTARRALYEAHLHDPSVVGRVLPAALQLLTPMQLLKLEYSYGGGNVAPTIGADAMDSLGRFASRLGAKEQLVEPEELRRFIDGLGPPHAAPVAGGDPVRITKPQERDRVVAGVKSSPRWRELTYDPKRPPEWAMSVDRRETVEPWAKKHEPQLEYTPGDPAQILTPAAMDDVVVTQDSKGKELPQALRVPSGTKGTMVGVGPDFVVMQFGEDYPEHGIEAHRFRIPKKYVINLKPTKERKLGRVVEVQLRDAIVYVIGPLESWAEDTEDESDEQDDGGAKDQVRRIADALKALPAGTMNQEFVTVTVESGYVQVVCKQEAVLLEAEWFGAPDERETPIPIDDHRLRALGLLPDGDGDYYLGTVLTRLDEINALAERMWQVLEAFGHRGTAVEITSGRDSLTSDLLEDQDDAEADDLDSEPGGPSLDAAYEILGLDAGADRETVRREYRKLVADYHPDKVASMAVGFRDFATKKLQEINAAYDLITERGGKEPPR